MNRRAHVFLLPLLSSLLAAQSGAQTVVSSRGEPYILDHWTVNNGLPQNTVASIVQTTDGFLWLGTNGGLVRFDGVRFQTFERLSTQDGRAYRVTSLVEGLDSSLWVGTEDGQLFRHHAGEFSPMLHREHAEPQWPILSMGMDSSGLVWLGRDRLGLARIMATPDQGDTVVQASLQPEWLQPAVTVVRASPDGSLWIAGAGVAQLRGAGIQTYLLPGLPPNIAVTAMSFDAEGGVWVGTSDLRLFRRLQRRFVEVPVGTLRVHYAFDEVLSGSRPELMAAVQSGILRFLDGRFHRAGTPEWDRAVQVRTVRADREGNFWMGTALDGLVRLRRATFEHWTLDNARRNVTSMVVDPARGVWVALNCGGVLLVRDGRVIPHEVSEALRGECVWALALDRRGSLWVGTWGNGLLRLDPDDPKGTMRRYGVSTGLRSDVVLALLPRRSGGMWVGTNTAGVALISGENVRSWGTAEGLPSDDVRSFAEDSLGRLWIGTQGGPAVLEESTVRVLGDGSTALNTPVRVVFIDPSGAVWFGTYGSGLLRWKNGQPARVTTQHGLYDNIVSQFIVGSEGYAWMGCNRGIWKVALQELNAFADGRVEQVTSIPYGVEDGLLTLETNGGFQPSGLRLPGGDLLFPTPVGIARTDPASMHANKARPPVVITNVLFDGSRKPVTPSTLVDAGVEEVRIEFTALSFTAPQKVRFKYQLIGYNKSWVDVHGDRHAIFTNVTPGTYRFRVIAANNDGVWNEEGAEITLTFELPYWQTLWFRALAVLALVGMGMLVVAIRLRQVRLEKERQEETSRRLIQSQEEERQRIAGELHDGLGQDLIVAKNRLLLAAHYLQDGTPAKEEMMNVVDSVSAALRSVRSIAYNLRPFQLDRLGLTETLRSTVRAVQGVTSIKIETEIATVDGLFSREAEIGVFRVIQEALTNVVKHSQATRASVVVAYDEGSVVIRIEDNGIGFAQPEGGQTPAFGFGLSSIAERARMLKGAHKFTSSPENGTTIAVRIPIEGNEPEPAPSP